jgi:chromosome segregation ATPase
MRAFEFRRLLAVAMFVAATIATGTAFAQQNRDDAEARLRTALRTVTVQLRQMEDQYGALQAKQAEAERARQDLTQKLAETEKELAALRQRVTTGEQALAQSSSRLRSTSAALETEKARLTKSQAETREAAQSAQAREAEVKRLDATLAATRKRALIAEAKNAELYRIGQDLMALYDRKGAFETLVYAEPVTRLKRVELENLLQGYRDRLSDSRVVRPQN